jgi:hypothetical protein
MLVVRRLKAINPNWDDVTVGERFGERYIILW